MLQHSGLCSQCSEGLVHLARVIHPETIWSTTEQSKELEAAEAGWPTGWLPGWQAGCLAAWHWGYAVYVLRALRYASHTTRIQQYVLNTHQNQNSINLTGASKFDFSFLRSEGQKSQLIGFLFDAHQVAQPTKIMGEQQLTIMITREKTKWLQLKRLFCLVCCFIFHLVFWSFAAYYMYQQDLTFLSLPTAARYPVAKIVENFRELSGILVLEISWY